ncbi:MULTISPECIES: copper-binding protein [Oryzomicrobium]|uniref:Uncharacterized protein n=1 Tax=Oryzomicrobium terrae TaxID=1735038 RepID=A0A5C1E6J3_9RHOO|nr:MULTISPECIES: copper-binding protein [Oryzomicrobium]MCE1243664.1 copper-binding protein [Oryzomicrobium sp.]QEL63927.1 hypothetical protein OTERR_04510 [Oryzomicrobium terrae]
MKRLFATSLFALASVAAFNPALAAEHGDHGMMHSQGTGQTLADATVKKVDQAAGKITLSHGPLPNGMPAMTMSFRLKDPSWANKVKEGQKVRFASAQIDGAMTVTRLEPAN